MSFDYDLASARRSMSKGYVLVRVPGHPRANLSGYAREHVVIAERALGHGLPLGAIVHHANGIKSDNRNDNLAILPDEAYHKALHVRMRVRAAGGDPFTERICATCQELTPLEKMAQRRQRKPSECKACCSRRVNARRIRLQSEGSCYRCGAVPADGGFPTCCACRKRQAGYQQGYVEVNRGLI